MKIQNIGRSTIFSYTLPEWNLNLHLIEAKNRNYVIDTGLGSESVQPILQQISRGKKPVIVINTHHHWDHIWGNHCFAGATIVAHTKCRMKIASLWDEMLRENAPYIRGEVFLALPNLTFEREIRFDDDGIRVFHTPGHTPDGISVYDEVDRVLNMGDTMGDTAAQIVPEIEGNPAVLARSVERCRRLGARVCVSGHNSSFDIKMLETLENTIKAGYNK